MQIVNTNLPDNIEVLLKWIAGITRGNLEKLLIMNDNNFGAIGSMNSRKAKCLFDLKVDTLETTQKVCFKSPLLTWLDVQNLTYKEVSFKLVIAWDNAHSLGINCERHGINKIIMIKYTINYFSFLLAYW